MILKPDASIISLLVILYLPNTETTSPADGEKFRNHQTSAPSISGVDVEQSVRFTRSSWHNHSSAAVNLATWFLKSGLILIAEIARVIAMPTRKRKEPCRKGTIRCHSSETFAWRLLDDYGVAVMPGSSFGTTATSLVRLALTVPDDVLHTAITRLIDLSASNCGS